MTEHESKDEEEIEELLDSPSEKKSKTEEDDLDDAEYFGDSDYSNDTEDYSVDDDE